jgi:hypothetical protein
MQALVRAAAQGEVEEDEEAGEEKAELVMAAAVLTSSILSKIG